MGLRPRWVDSAAHPTFHFDQLLHAYYFDRIRGAQDDDNFEDRRSNAGRVEAFHEANRANPAAALQEAARWWAGLPSDLFDEERFIRETAPEMRRRFSQDAVRTMDLAAFTEALRHVNAFRMHARQIKNAEFGLPADHHETIDQRVERLCGWLWEQGTASGRTVRDLLEFVLWGSSPADMEHRLWLAVSDDDYKLPHFGRSTLGEAIGWARPDEFPPRNNRTNKALRALGYNVKLF